MGWREHKYGHPPATCGMHNYQTIGSSSMLWPTLILPSGCVKALLELLAIQHTPFSHPLASHSAGFLGQVMARILSVLLRDFGASTFTTGGRKAWLSNHARENPVFILAVAPLANGNAQNLDRRDERGSSLVPGNCDVRD